MNHTPDTSDSHLSAVIVGCGIIGLNHAKAMLLHSGLTITALVDAVPPAAHALADEIVDLGGTRPREYDTLAAALEAEPCDLVAICTPSGLHIALADEAVAAGKHVVIEKPLDVSLPRARQLCDVAQRAHEKGIIVSVISQHRFDPASIVVSDAARAGRFGRITSAVASVAWWRTQEYYDSGQWRGTWELDGGGAVMNQGVHTVDLLLWFLGRPIDVDARTALLAHDRIEVEDVAVATVRFASGALAVFHATTAAFPGLSVRIGVYGDRGSAIIDNDQLTYFAADGARRNSAARVIPASERRRRPDDFMRGHLRQYEDVVDAIRSHREPGVTVTDALLALAVVRAIYISATLGRTVTIDEILDGSLDTVNVRTGGTE